MTYIHDYLLHDNFTLKTDRWKTELFRKEYIVAWLCVYRKMIE